MTGLRQRVQMSMFELILNLETTPYTPGVPGDLGVEHTDQDLSSWRRCLSSETILFQRYYRLFWARLNTIMS